MDINFVEKIREASQRISPFINRTPLEPHFQLSQALNGQVFMKMENWQKSGSFKIRGVLNKILSFSEEHRKEQHFVAASTGNHAAAFAYAMQLFGLSGEVFVPKQVNPVKKALIETMDMQCRLVGDSSLETEIFTRTYAEENGYTLVHPYNDWDIVFGQGTIALEILKTLPETDVIVVPVGGGGMIGGIAAYAKSIKQNIRIIGVQPENSPEMYESIKKGRIIKEEISQPTLSDGTAGGIEQGAVTFNLCRDFVDEIVLISELEIANALKDALKKQQFIIEGAAAMSLAMTKKRPDLFYNRHTVLVLCGRRLSFDKLKDLVEAT